MFLSPILLFSLKQAFYVSCALLNEASSTRDLALSSTGANTSAATSQEVREPITFPIDGSPLQLLIVPLNNIPLNQNAIRDILFHNYIYFSDLIASEGDDELPPELDPFKAKILGAYFDLHSDSRDRPLRYSNVRDVLWGLKEYTVMQGHWVGIQFSVGPKPGVEPEGTMGAGQLLRFRPPYSPSTE